MGLSGYRCAWTCRNGAAWPPKRLLWREGLRSFLQGRNDEFALSHRRKLNAEKGHLPPLGPALGSVAGIFGWQGHVSKL